MKYFSHIDYLQNLDNERNLDSFFSNREFEQFIEDVKNVESETGFSFYRTEVWGPNNNLNLSLKEMVTRLCKDNTKCREMYRIYLILNHRDTLVWQAYGNLRNLPVYKKGPDVCYSFANTEILSLYLEEDTYAYTNRIIKAHEDRLKQFKTSLLHIEQEKGLDSFVFSIRKQIATLKSELKYERNSMSLYEYYCLLPDKIELLELLHEIYKDYKIQNYSAGKQQLNVNDQDDMGFNPQFSTEEYSVLNLIKARPDVIDPKDKKLIKDLFKKLPSNVAIIELLKRIPKESIGGKASHKWSQTQLAEILGLENRYAYRKLLNAYELSRKAQKSSENS